MWRSQRSLRFCMPRGGSAQSPSGTMGMLMVMTMFNGNNDGSDIQQ